MCSAAMKREPKAPVEKRREVDSRLAPPPGGPNAFMIARRLKDLDLRQQRMEELLAHLCLLVQGLESLVQDGPPERLETRFRHPGPTVHRPSRLPAWKRWLWGFFFPERLRDPHPEAWAHVPV